MKTVQGYVLGDSARAAQRLEIQDAHFADVSERLLDDLALRPNDRVVELGCGAGGLSKRILKRLGKRGTLVAVDRTQGLLDQCRAYVVGVGEASFEPILGDLTELGPWLDHADVVTGRAVLHHVAMAEFLLGKLHARLKAGTRVGFIEPDFRSPLAKLTYLEATGRTDLKALRTWAIAINELYLANRISPAVGATLAKTLEMAGYRNVRSEWLECRSNANTLENMSMFYDEVRDRLDALGILSKEETDRQQRLLAALPPEGLPAVWGVYRVAAES